MKSKQQKQTTAKKKRTPRQNPHSLCVFTHFIPLQTLRHSLVYSALFCDIRVCFSFLLTCDQYKRPAILAIRSSGRCFLISFVHAFSLACIRAAQAILSPLFSSLLHLFDLSLSLVCLLQFFSVHLFSALLFFSSLLLDPVFKQSYRLLYTGKCLPLVSIALIVPSLLFSALFFSLHPVPCLQAVQAAIKLDGQQALCL